MTLASTDRLADLAEAWDVIQERVTDAKVIEFANLLLAFEASQANGSGALYFNACQGKVEQWGVRSDTVDRVKPLAYRAKRA